jgi:hypothetical protein
MLFIDGNCVGCNHCFFRVSMYASKELGSVREEAWRSFFVWCIQKAAGSEARQQAPEAMKIHACAGGSAAFSAAAPLL